MSPPSWLGDLSPGQMFNATQSLDHKRMKVLRFLIGLIGFLVVWILVAGLITLPIRSLFQNARGEILGVQWITIPGSILGVIAGCRVYQMLTGDRAGKK